MRRYRPRHVHQHDPYVCGIDLHTDCASCRRLRVLEAIARTARVEPGDVEDLIVHLATNAMQRAAALAIREDV